MGIKEDMALTESAGQRLDSAGFKVSPPHRGFFSSVVKGVRGGTPRPELVVQGHTGKTAYVEFKTTPVSLTDIRNIFDHAPSDTKITVICTPEKVFAQIADSVRSYADETGVHLCHEVELEDVTRTLLA